MNTRIIIATIMALLAVGALGVALKYRKDQKAATAK